jgi:hypothetical protein
MDPRAGTTIGAKVAKVPGVKNALQDYKDVYGYHDMFR